MSECSDAPRPLSCSNDRGLQSEGKSAGSIAAEPVERPASLEKTVELQALAGVAPARRRGTLVPGPRYRCWAPSWGFRSRTIRPTQAIRSIGGAWLLRSGLPKFSVIGARRDQLGDDHDMRHVVPAWTEANAASSRRRAAMMWVSLVTRCSRERSRIGPGVSVAKASCAAL